LSVVIVKGLLSEVSVYFLGMFKRQCMGHSNDGTVDIKLAHKNRQKASVYWNKLLPT